MRKARADAAAKTLPAGDALDGRTHDRHVAGGDIEHALDGGRIPGRAFAFHPAAQSLQHSLGIKGKIGWVHGLLLDFSWISLGFLLGFEQTNLTPALTRMIPGEFVK